MGSVLTVKWEQMAYLVTKQWVNSNNNFAFLDLRKATIPIFYDMMKVEFAERQSFQQVKLIISQYRPWWYLIHILDIKIEYDSAFFFVEKLFLNVLSDCGNLQFKK